MKAKRAFGRVAERRRPIEEKVVRVKQRIYLPANASIALQAGEYTNC